MKDRRERTGNETDKTIIEERPATEEDHAKTLSQKLRIPFLDLSNYIVDPAVVGILNEDVARRLLVLPLYIIKDTLTIAMADPMDIYALDAVRAISKFKSIQVMAATKSAIVKCIEQNYISGKSLEDII